MPRVPSVSSPSRTLRSCNSVAARKVSRWLSYLRTSWRNSRPPRFPFTPSTNGSSEGSLLGFSKRNKFTESQLRSVTKVVTWRVMVTLTNFLGGLISSDDWRVGLGVAGFALVVNSTLYWFHERFWNWVP